MLYLEYIEHAVFASVVAVYISIYIRKGLKDLLRILVLSLKELPGVESIIGSVLHSEVTNFLQSTALQTTSNSKKRTKVQLPHKGKEVCLVIAGELYNSR